MAESLRGTRIACIKISRAVIRCELIRETPPPSLLYRVV
jgi:hypothetical protein